MKKAIQILFLLQLCFYFNKAQISDSSNVKKWDLGAETYFYFFSGDFLFLPVLKADRGVLHLEARYNYENYNAVSAWAGYNFTGGKKIEYTITPMGGLVVGSTRGLAPGLEFSFSHKSFEWYTETEYVFDLNSSSDNFYYMWSDLSYSLTESFWLGLSAQRTRLYKTELDIQRGVYLGAAIKNWEIHGYLYNLFFDEPFVLLSLAFNR